MTAELAAFATARLDEAEAAAREGRGLWPFPAVEDSGAVWLHVKRGGGAVIVHYPHPVEGYGDMADLRKWADTGYGWTRDRALRDIAAKRAIIAEYTAFLQNANEQRASGELPGAGINAAVKELERVVRMIAAIDSDHPDYRAWMAL